MHLCWRRLHGHDVAEALREHKRLGVIIKVMMFPKLYVSDSVTD